MEVEHHVVAELAGAEQFSLLGDLEAVGHRNGVEHLRRGKMKETQESFASNRTNPMKQVDSHNILDARLNREQDTCHARQSTL